MIAIYERTFDVEVLGVLDPGVLGLLATVAIANAGMSTRKRWPAAAALVGASPVGFAMVKSVPLLLLVEYIGASFVLAFFATLGTQAPVPPDYSGRHRATAESLASRDR